MKDSREEKEAGERTGRSCKKLRKEQKTLYYFIEKEEFFSGFVPFVKFAKFNLTGYNI